jgi:anti-sigma regulatory factor (Ser/Thr protein kinase)
VPRTATCLELALPAVSTSVRRAREAVGEVVANVAGDERLADDVRLCVSEAVSNVVRHAYPGGARGDAEIVVEQEAGQLNVVVRDTGSGVTPAKRSQSGGFGLKIIDKLTTRYTFTSKQRVGTEVRMVFPLGTDSRPTRG